MKIMVAKNNLVMVVVRQTSLDIYLYIFTPCKSESS